MDSQACFLLLLLFIIPAALGQAVCGTDACITDCTACNDNEMVADPSDCRRYFMCDGKDNTKYPLPFDCPDGEIFDATQHKCDPDVTCSPCPRCYYDCATSTTGFISSPTDCNEYSVCSGSNAEPTMRCPAAMPHFDGHACQTDASRCCHCQPYCYPGQENTLIIDPIDCRKFHPCTAAGPPTGSGTCSAGQHFDESLHDCSHNAPCNTQCTNQVGTDGCIELFTCLEVGNFAKCPSAVLLNTTNAPGSRTSINHPPSATSIIRTMSSVRIPISVPTKTRVPIILLPR
ncbi:hypothetical protein GWK47_034924 [Chionoecetes opilio]|uniref:Chitin-binding type-2 domain-containing protein n=1 Tax=Chionoecetes opilio TaxID=41210 RepID=A0A8J5CNW2_CHIOP|nr:hypothetical protein GWK47_034924 [Chionoecetes opilio]